MSAHYFVTSRSQQSGREVTVGHGDDLGLDVIDDGPWYTICEEHSEMCSHRTLKLARHHSADPLGWCEQCRDAS